MLAADFEARLGTFELTCNLSVARGETIALVGASGSGKTSVLRTIAGLVHPRRGRIAWDDAVWFDAQAGLCAPAAERSCGMVFAEYALFGHLSALDNVAFGPRARGTPSSIARKEARALLDVFGVAPLARRRAASLSSGEMQRVAIARALANEPLVLLLDEPFSAIDVERRPPVRDALLRWVGDANAGAVLVTHDPIEAMLFANELIVLEGGKIVQRGSAQQLREHPHSSYVAAFAGVNLYRGVASPQPGGTSTVAVNGARLAVIGAWHGAVALVVDPDAVILSKAKPDSSARNCLWGPVASAYPEGNAVRVSVNSSPPVVARITRQSAVEFGVEPGAMVYATFKASEVRVH
jgi:molybdate transport system ATP-binding protein